MNKNDLRYRRTHRRIVESFIALLEEKSVAAITIQQIVERAECNRNTFYLHFKDKVDLMEQVNVELMELVSSELRIPLPLGNGGDEAVLQYLRNVLACFENRSRVFRLMRRNDPAFHLQIQDAVRDGIIASSRTRGIRRGKEATLQIYAEYIAAGITSAAFSWLEEEVQMDRETFVRLLGGINIPASRAVVQTVLARTEDAAAE